MIVDSQVHLWGPETPERPWIPGGQARAHLPEPLTWQRFVPMMDEAGVDRVVVVPPSWPGDRNDYALEAARRYPGRFAVMGRLPLERLESEFCGIGVVVPLRHLDEVRTHQPGQVNGHGHFE